MRRAGADLVVFPELSLTGYDLDASVVSTADGVLSPLVEACRLERSTALVGAPVADEDGRQYIAMLHVSAAGVRVAYRKMHLGGAEAVRFSPGQRPGAEHVGGWAVGTGICKDTGSQEHVKAVAELGVDLYVAGLVHRADETAVQDERGASIARHCGVHVAFASFAGPTGEGYDASAGRSSIWDPTGTLVARAGTQPGEIARARLTSQAGESASGRVR